MNFPFKARIIDLRFPNCDYPVTIKNTRDFELLKELKNSTNFRIEYKKQEIKFNKELTTA